MNIPTKLWLVRLRGCLNKLTKVPWRLIRLVVIVIAGNVVVVVAHRVVVL